MNFKSLHPDFFSSNCQQVLKNMSGEGGAFIKKYDVFREKLDNNKSHGLDVFTWGAAIVKKSNCEELS